MELRFINMANKFGLMMTIDVVNVRNWNKVC